MGRSRNSGRGRPRRGRGGRSGGGGFRRNPRAFLRGLIGHTLEGVQADLASDTGVVADEPIQLVLQFSDGNQVSLLPSSDGESLRISRKEQAPFPADEPGMKLIRKTQTEEPQWLPFLGKRCEDIIEVRDTCISSKGIWCGVEFVFEGGMVFTAYNWNDVLVAHAPPEDTGFLERLTVQKAEEEGDDRKDSGRKEGSDGDGKKGGEDAKATGAADGEAKEGSGSEESQERKPRRKRRSRGERHEYVDSEQGEAFYSSGGPRNKKADKPAGDKPEAAASDAPAPEASAPAGKPSEGKPAEAASEADAS